MSDQNTELYRAVESGDLSEVQRLLQLGADVDYKNVNDRQKAPLHIAARNGNLEVAKLLLLHNANIEATSDYEWTPLHYAVDNGHMEVAELLLENRANIEAADNDKDQWTPLHYAAVNGHLEVATLLLSYGANVEAANKDGLTPLHYAAVNGYLEVAKLLLLKRANVEAADEDGLTPLHWATRNGHLEVAKLLLSNGANIEAADIDGWTPLHYLEKCGLSMVTERFREYQKAKPKTFLSLLFSLDSNNTQSPDSLRLFLFHLARIITNVHEMKLFYTLLRAILAQGLIHNDDCVRKILHKALEMTANSTRSNKEVSIYKLILDKCFEDAMIDWFTFNVLDRTAENTNTQNQPFIQDMKAAIEKNKKDILKLRCDVESIKNNIVILEKNIRSVHSAVETMKDALRFKQKVEAVLGMLKVVISAVSFGYGGGFVDTFVGAIVDFGDLQHLQEVASGCTGEDEKSLIKKSLQHGIDAAKENMGVLVKCTAELGVNVVIAKRMDEALEKGDPLFVLGYVSVFISAQVSPNPKTLTMDGILMNSSVSETNIAECVFPDAILSEDDEKRLEVHATIKYGLKEDLEALLQKEEFLVSMNETDSEGRTAADLAALTGQVELWTILIEKGGKHEFESKPKMKKKVQNRKERSSQYLDWIEKQCT